MHGLRWILFRLGLRLDAQSHCDLQGSDSRLEPGKSLDFCSKDIQLGLERLE
jgi:hypothetical protein